MIDLLTKILIDCGIPTISNFCKLCNFKYETFSNFKLNPLKFITMTPIDRTAFQEIQ